MGVQQGIYRTLDNAASLHYVNHPAHAASLLRVMLGDLQSLNDNGSDDTLLYAYQVKEALDRQWGHMLAMYTWASKVIESTPDEIQETGAQPCR